MDKKQLEIRNLGHLEVRDDEQSRHIEGCAIVFNSPSVDLGFREVIEPTAITQELIDNSDIYLNFNHDDSKILGRWNKGQGSLSLDLREDGLYFSIDAPKTDLGDEVLEYLHRGDVDKCSFCFWIDYDDEDAETWNYEEGVALRTIHKIAGLHDVSIVWNPAYSDTQVSARSLEKLQELKKRKKRRKMSKHLRMSLRRKMLLKMMTKKRKRMSLRRKMLLKMMTRTIQMMTRTIQMIKKILLMTKK